METISVVIPVFNSAAYLRECVDSVLGQSYSALDVILVDDGSSDESPEICREYTERDSRVRFLRPEPMSVGAARNYGIDHANGKYLMFVDSDDVCEPALAETLLRNRGDEGSGSVLPICGILVTDADGKETGAFREETATGRMSVQDYIRNILGKWQSNPLCGGVYCKLFETDVLRQHGIRFEEKTTYAEDFLFNLAYLSHGDFVTVLSDTLYRYRIGRSGSLTEKNLQKADPEEIWKRRKQVIRAYEDVFRQYGLAEECEGAIRAFRLKNVTDVVEMAVRQDARGEEFAAWMAPLREYLQQEAGKGFSEVPGKYRMTLRFLNAGQYELLREYEKTRRKIRILRGRER